MICLEQVKWYFFTSENVEKVPQESGVYWLGLYDGSVIYIGQSTNLNQRLRQHLSTSDIGLKEARMFAFQCHSYPEQRERELLREFWLKNGRLPKCNDKF